MTVTEAFTYDDWSRIRYRTDGTGSMSTTFHDAVGRVNYFDDGYNAYSYTYDGYDTLGRVEHRGLVTEAHIGWLDGDYYRMAGAYDESGGLIRQDLPGWVTQTWTRDVVGQVTSMSYGQTGDVDYSPEFQVGRRQIPALARGVGVFLGVGGRSELSGFGAHHNPGCRWGVFVVGASVRG